MKKIGIILGVALVGVLVAVTYHLFENAVHGAISLVWYDWFNTSENRIFVLPLAIIISVVFFGLQHCLDAKSEGHQEHGLGEMPTPSLLNFAKVLLIGFFSLLAGASLGPEAILVPACMIVGGMVGQRIVGGDEKNEPLVKLFSAAGIMALFTAFFHSAFVGVLSLFLVMRQAKVKFQPILLVVALVSSVASYYTLQLIEAEAYAPLPEYNWSLTLNTVFISVLLLGIGYVLVVTMDKAVRLFQNVREYSAFSVWWVRGLLAGGVLGAIYLVGGPLVEFTGNLSIQPLFADAASIGLSGLLLILVAKIAAIGWSKAIGYRGGMIFPTIFLAAVVVAIIQVFVKDYNLIYGMIAVIIGALAANKKNHTLV